ncbi:MAG: Tat pathway signal protein [Hymenobacter sp.]|nr:Tat pathway signal protein [Hymenobacter sp.]
MLPTGADLRELVRLATLAPSGHNTQPWKFRVGAGSILLYPDLTRRVPVVDPDNRELWISLGSALENLLVAAARFGYQTETTYHLTGTSDDHIAVALQKTGPVPAGRSPLFEAIPLRQSTRSVYDGKPVPGGELRQLEAAATGDGVTPLLFTGAAAMEPLLEYVEAGNEQQLTNDDFKKELVHWLRFNDREALASKDGLLSRGSGNPSLPRWVANLFIGSSLKPTAQSKKDALHVRSSAGLVLFTSPQNDPAAWIATGRASERFALLTTTLNLKTAYLNQPCEVPAVRAQVQAQLGLHGAFPQLLMRFGHGPAMPRSLRRPVSEVLTIAAS